MMTLGKGESSSDEVSNEHPRSEQWLFVISGSGVAIVASRTKKTRSTKERTVRIRTGSLILIEKRERHQIRNTGRRPLKTINFYVPPAYSKDGEVKSRAKR